MPDLTFGDHLCLAGVAHRWKVPALVEALLQAAAADHPLSASEIVELATTYKEVGDETSAQQMLNELITLPLIILENCGDISLVLEGLELAAELQPLKVVDLLVGLLLSDSTEWWNVVEILATLVEVEGEVAALIHATPRIEELGRSIKNATDTDSVAWPYLVGEFMERGWFNDHAALLAFARNEACSISERAEACALLIRFAFTGSSVWCAAQDLLAQFRVHDTLSISDRIAITTELRRQNCKKEAQDWLDQCLRLPLRETKDHRDLARLLFDFGRNAEAKALVESISASEFAKDFMAQRDEELLAFAVGQDVAEAATLERVFDNDASYDQLWRAREYVEKHCDRRALSLILNTAMAADDDPRLQLEAIECLEQLGFRELSRCRFSEMKKETVEPYWLANQLMQFGRKLEAAPLFITAALSSP